MVKMPIWLYAIICVVAPMAWGLLMVAVTGFFERRLLKPSTEPGSVDSPVQDAASRPDPPQIEYHI